MHQLERTSPLVSIELYTSAIFSLTWRFSSTLAHLFRTLRMMLQSCFFRYFRHDRIVPDSLRTRRVTASFLIFLTNGSADKANVCAPLRVLNKKTRVWGLKNLTARLNFVTPTPKSPCKKCTALLTHTKMSFSFTGSSAMCGLCQSFHNISTST